MDVDPIWTPSGPTNEHSYHVNQPIASGQRIAAVPGMILQGARGGFFMENKFPSTLFATTPGVKVPIVQAPVSNTDLIARQCTPSHNDRAERAVRGRFWTEKVVA